MFRPASATQPRSDLVKCPDARDGWICLLHTIQALPRADQAHPAPVLMITALEDAASVDRAFEAGAADYVTKPIHWAVLNQRVRRLIQQYRLQQQQSLLQQQLEAANLALQHLAMTDSLTGLANRRHFDHYFDQEWKRMAREQQPLSLILCDVDFLSSTTILMGIVQAIVACQVWRRLVAL